MPSDGPRLILAQRVLQDSPGGSLTVWRCPECGSYPGGQHGPPNDKCINCRREQYGRPLTESEIADLLDVRERRWTRNEPLSDTVAYFRDPRMKSGKGLAILEFATVADRLAWERENGMRR